MSTCFKLSARLLVFFAAWHFATARAADTNAVAVFSGALTRLVSIVAPQAGATPQTLTTTVKLVKASGLPAPLIGHEFTLALQAPNHLRLSTRWENDDYVIGRAGEELWVHVPAKKFGLIGKPGVARFSNDPDSTDNSRLGPLKLPVPAEQLLVLPFLTEVEALPDEAIDGANCKVIKATPKEEAVRGFNFPRGTLTVWARAEDSVPVRLSYTDGKKIEVQVEFAQAKFSDPWPAEQWQLKSAPSDNIETVARSHLTRFLDVAMANLGRKIPPLGPATGERRVVAREGAGRLEVIDGTRVLVLKGTPEEMGRQHGALLKKEVRNLVDQMLYGVGVGSSFAKGRWFFGEIESAQKRLKPFMDQRYFREMDALASAAGLPPEEVRLANFFPELFHCSGFALLGKATVDGKVYHGRILDYLRGLGLEQNAVVLVLQPDVGNAWVNVGYAGFVGSVTAMNEKKVAIGEMGGRGEGNWDGKPMAQLVREVMEKANTLEEAVEIMRKGPRTCEYYYVISDAKSKRAVGIAATPQKFETIWPGKSHPQLPHAIPDAVLMSAGDRYEELAGRVKAGYGKFDAEKARDLMKRPVCMTSNIHSALFAPDTLDFWVANADSENVASHARYTHYNLLDLLQETKTTAAR